MKNSFTTYFNNLPLNKKLFLTTTLVNIFLITSVNLLGACTIIRSYNKSLYQSVAASLSYSGTEIKKTLDIAFTMANVMLADTTIQNTLSALQQDQPQPTAYTTLYNRVQAYYYEYKENNISHVHLMTNRFNTESYRGRHTLSDDVLGDIKQQAIAADGAAIWITDYATDYGLLLTRLLRKIEDLSLAPLGVLTITVDIDAALRNSNAFNQYEDATYLLYKGEDLIYHSNASSLVIPDSFFKELSSGYAITTLNNHRFFAVKDLIPQYGWNYVLLIPYDAIKHSVYLSILLYTGVVIISIFLSLLLSNLLLGSLTKHFGVLINKMRKYSSSEMLVIEDNDAYHHRQDEIGELHRQFHHMASEIQELIQVNYLNQILLKDAEIKALEMQINPHFLYNTLESINWRAKQVGEKQISQMVESLGNLLRITLKKTDDYFTLGDELQLVTAYLTIQKIRFEERLEYTILCDPTLLSCCLPKLTIQPLVENAITHALEEMIDTCTIEIVVTPLANNLAIEVRNNGSQFEAQLLEKLKAKELTPSGLGLALLNVDQRAKLAFGNEYGLRFKNTSQLAIVTLFIPSIYHP